MEPDNTREWYYESDGERKGPVSERRMLADRELSLLDGDTLVWTSGLEDWVKLDDALEMSTNPVPRPAAASPEATVSAGLSTEDPGREPGEPVETCAWSGEIHPRSGMLPFGESWVAPAHREAFVQHLAETGESPDVPMEGYPFPDSLTLDTVFGQCFRIFGAQWKTILILTVGIYGPVTLVTEFLSRNVLRDFLLPESDTETFTSSLLDIWVPISLGMVTEIFIGAFVAAGLFSMTRDRWHGKSELETGDLFAAGWRNLGRVLLTRLLLYGLYIGIGATAGFAIASGGGLGPIFFLGMLAFVLIVVLTVRLTSAEPLSVIERRAGSRALARSWELTRGNFWRILGYRLLVLVSAGMIAGVVGLVVEIPLPVFQNFLTAAIIATLVAIPTSFVCVFETVLAIHLKGSWERREASSQA